MTEPQSGPGSDPARGARPGSAHGALVWVAGTAAALTIGYLFRGLLLPLFLAAGLAYLLNPVVAWAEGLAIRRSVAVAGLFAAVGLVLVGGGLLLGPRVRVEAVAFVRNLPSLAAEVDEAIEAAGREVGDAMPVLRKALPSRHARQVWIDRLIEGRAGSLPDVLERAGTVFLVVVLVPLFLFFILRDSRRMLAFVMDRLPPAHIETSVAVCCEIDRIIGRYLRGVALDGIAVGVLASAGLWAIGVPYPLLLGAFAGLANAVPYLGPLLGAGAAGLVALTHAQGLGAVGRVLLLFVGIKALDDAVIQVLTIGRSVHLHPMLLLASVVAGNQALGVLGMLVAVPAVTVLQETARLLLEHRRVLAGTLPAPGEPAGIPHVVC